jgi:hypothetical protein
VASLATSTGAYIYAPRLAAYFPRAASAFQSVTGLGGAAALEGGGALLVGGAIAVEAAGIVLAIEGVGHLAIAPVVDTLMEAGDPNKKLVFAAQDQEYDDFAQSSDGVGGFMARNFSFINKAALGFGMAVSSDLRTNHQRAVGNVLNQWIDDTNNGAKYIDGLLLAAAASSLEPSKTGVGYQLNQTKFETNTRELFGREKNLQGWADRVKLISPTDWAPRITSATKITGLIGTDGWIRDQAGMNEHIGQLLVKADQKGQLNQIFARIAQGEQVLLQQRLAELDLQRPIPTSSLNAAQYRFLYEKGPESEGPQSRARMEYYQGLEKKTRERGSLASQISL